MEKRKAGRPSNNDSRKSEILEKATYCFTVKGYDNTTLDEIGDSLGFNKSALYYYFKNKEDLFSQVVNYERSRLWKMAKDETNEEKGFENKIIKYLVVRSETIFVLIKLNELTKFNLIEITPSYVEATSSFRDEETEFLLKIFENAKIKHSTDEIKEFINLLFDVQGSITMSNILLRNIESNVAILTDLKINKINIFKHLLNSFLTGKKIK